LLYKELRDKLLQINENLEDFLKLYMDSINNIELADPNTDYDKYCNNNKLNDKRKGMAMFIVNLMKIDIIDKNSILEIIITLQDLVLQYVDEENKMVVYLNRHFMNSKKIHLKGGTNGYYGLQMKDDMYDKTGTCETRRKNVSNANNDFKKVTQCM
jgi:hypothetical protein